MRVGGKESWVDGTAGQGVMEGGLQGLVATVLLQKPQELTANKCCALNVRIHSY